MIIFFVLSKSSVWDSIYWSFLNI